MLKRCSQHPWCAEALIKRAQNLLVQYKEMDVPQDRVLLRIPGEIPALPPSAAVIMVRPAVVSRMPREMIPCLHAILGQPCAAQGLAQQQERGPAW